MTPMQFFEGSRTEPEGWGRSTSWRSVAWQHWRWRFASMRRPPAGRAPHLPDPTTASSTGACARYAAGTEGDDLPAPSGGAAARGPLPL